MTARPHEPTHSAAVPQYSLVGGKGGVGKTTCAAAIAVTAARSGLRTLVISTDPAPSLADAFGRALRAVPTRIPVRGGPLHAVEIDAPRALERWLGARRDAFRRIALRGTWLDEEDVARILRLTLPGIDEIASLLEVLRFGRSGRFDLIVVNTAPTGHALRMLSMPEMLTRVAQVFDAMQEKHRLMVDMLRGGWEPEADDVLIDELAQDARELRKLLREGSRLQTTWVTLAEPMAVAETADGIAALAREGIRVERVVINRLLERPPSACRRCDAQRAFEQGSVAAIVGAARGGAVVGVRARPGEPRGLPALRSIGDELASSRPIEPVRARTVQRWRSEIASGNPADPGTLFAGPATRLVMFGGKGGVGKTTCAAASAIEIANGFPTRRILLLSTDPAHSLGDALGVALSDEARTPEGAPANLFVRELDAVAQFADVRARYAAAVEAVFARVSKGTTVDIRQEGTVMRNLMELAPPGIDEVVGLSEVTDALTGGAGAQAFDLVVMDMAPTGHALRLLETPEIVQDWAKALMSILLKYQAVVGVGELGALLLRLSQGIGRLRTLLRDPRQTRFVAVTRGARLPSAETMRLVRRLARMKIRVAALIVNAAGRGTCARCRREAAAEAREITGLQRSSPTRGLPLVVAPAEVPPPHGQNGLQEWAGAWRVRQRRRGISSNPA